MPTLGVFGAIAITLAAVALGIAARRIMAAWIRFRGQFLVNCPQDGRPVGVTVDRTHAALTAWGGNPSLRLDGCAHWPERAGCGQPCVRQMEAAPQDCLVRNILTHWYEGKYCARCGAPVGEIYWAGWRPVLLVGDVTKEWAEIPAEQLPAVLETARPVCFDCYLQEKAAGPPLKLQAS